jgi:hypothetical protein
MKTRKGWFAFACTLLTSASLLQAQREADANPGVESDFRTTSIHSTFVPDLVTNGKTAATVSSTLDQAAPSTAPAPDNQWHLSVSPYLWFPGVHGSVGAVDRTLSIHASATDLLSHFRFGLMGTVEATHNRVLIPIDLLYIRLRDDKGIPLPGSGATSAIVTGTEFIFTPKVGLTVIKKKMFQADALAGIRFWHFGESLHFNPSIFGLDFSRSQNWVDPLVGGRITVPFSPKLSTTVSGDVGGWGTGSQLEYQVAGLLGYKIKPHMTLQAGYRYLDVDYSAGGAHGGILDAAMSGIVFGVTINLK